MALLQQIRKQKFFGAGLGFHRSLTEITGAMAKGAEMKRAGDAYTRSLEIDLPAAVLEEAVLSIGIGVFSICLLLYAFIGFQNRYISDDYSTAWLQDQYGFWHSQAILYTGWTGRFSFAFIDQVLQSLGFSVAKLLPPITLGLWLGVILSLIASIHELYYAGKDSKVCIFVACSILYTLIYAAPSLFQSFYWRTGIITYPIPIIILLVFLRMVLRADVDEQRHSGYENVSVFGLLLFAGGFSETNLIIQIIIIGVLLGNTWLHRDRRQSRALRLLTAGFFGSLVSLAIVAGAPGNQVRRSFFPAHLPFLELIQRTLREAFSFGGASLLTSKTVILFLIFTVWALLRTTRSQPHNVANLPCRDLLIGTVIVVLSLLASFGLSLYAMTSLPPTRALFVPRAVIIGGVLQVGYFVATRIHNSRAWTFVNSKTLRIVCALTILVLLVAGPALTAVRLGFALPRWTEYAKEWDQRQRYMSQESSSHRKSIVIKSLHHPERLDYLDGIAGDIQGDLQLGENRDLAHLYGFEHVLVVR
jgi:hypothetical protein